jgi:hypothetical protein
MERLEALQVRFRELEKWKLDLVGVQEVRWEKGGAKCADDYTFSYGEGNEDRRTGFFVHKEPGE